MSGALIASGLSRNPVELAAITVDQVGLGVTTSGFRFNSDGTIDENNSGSYGQIATWYKGAPVVGIGASYNVRALSAGKTGTWTAAAASDDVDIAMSSDREWNVVQVAPAGSKQAVATFEIRKVGLTRVLDSAQCQAEAERT